MFSRVKIVHITFILLAFGTLAQGTAAEPSEPGAAPGSQVVRGDQLTKQQFEALPDTALINFKGQQMTKAQIRVRATKSQEAMEKGHALARQTRAEFEQRLIHFEQQRKAKIQADKAKAMEEFARQSQAEARQLKAIEAEAAQLYKRSEGASPAEKAQIEQRASQLLQQLQEMDHP
jgi:hypothetical protein